MLGFFEYFWNRFLQNCVFDPAELLTVRYNKRASFSEPADLYRELTEFDDDPTWWFEYLGLRALELGDKYIHVQGSLQFQSPHDAKEVDTLIATNLLGYYPDASARFYDLLERTQPKQVFLNMPVAEGLETARYRGKAVYPYDLEKIQAFCKQMNAHGYYLEGGTDFENVDLGDVRNLPHTTSGVSRARLLFTTDIPF